MKHLIVDFQHFHRRVFPHQRELSKKLAFDQQSSTMFITCADSRVMPELTFATQPDQRFAYRNFGHTVLLHAQHVDSVIPAIEDARRGRLMGIESLGDQWPKAKPLMRFDTTAASAA